MSILQNLERSPKKLLCVKGRGWEGKEEGRKKGEREGGREVSGKFHYFQVVSLGIVSHGILSFAFFNLPKLLQNQSIIHHVP